VTYEQAIEAIKAAGYDPSQSSTDETIYVAIADGEDDDAEAALAELRTALPGLDVSWTGNGDTWGDGSTTSDVSVSGFSDES
jgi:hypothetical protein